MVTKDLDAGTGEIMDILRSRPLVFVDDLAAPTLTKDDNHHLAKVLRLNDGAEIVISDGGGLWRAAKFAMEPYDLGDICSVSPPARVALAFALIKGDRSEFVVQKATELGVTEITPIVTERTIPRWNAGKVKAANMRQQKIAKAAAMQSKRTWLPQIAPLTTLEQYMACNPDAVLADPAGELLRVESNPHRTVVIGPEGGFSDRELALAPCVTLPGGVLRAETAAIVAAALMARSVQVTDS